MTTSAPRPSVRPWTAATGVLGAGSTTWVAPSVPAQLAAVGDRVDGDDLAGARDLRGLHHPLAEVAEADDRDALARLDLGDVEDGAQARS